MKRVPDHEVPDPELERLSEELPTAPADEDGARRGVRMRSASWILASNVLTLFASFPMSILLARTLGPAGKGTLSVVQLIATFSGVLFNFGLGQAFMYYAARREARGRDAIVLSYVSGFLIAGTLALLAIPFGDSIARTLNVSPRVLVYAGLILTGPVLISQFLNAYVVGTGAIRNASLVNVASLFSQFAAVVVLWATHHLTTATAIAVWAVAISGATVAYTVLAWPGKADKSMATGWTLLLKRVWRYGFAIWPAAILGTAAQRSDVFLLAHFKGPADVGIYSIAVTFAELCWYVPNALAGVMVPKVAAEREEGTQIVLRMSRVTWVLTLTVGLLILAIAIPLIPVVFGPRFRGSILPLALILPGIVMMSMSTAAGSYLVGRGHPFDATIAATINLVANVVANVVLIPRLGPVGAAIASTISYSLAGMVVIGFFLMRSGSPIVETLVPKRSDFAALFSAAARALTRGRA